MIEQTRWSNDGCTTMEKTVDENKFLAVWKIRERVRLEESTYNGVINVENLPIMKPFART